MADAAVMEKSNRKGARIQIYAPSWMVWQLERLGDVEDPLQYVARDMIIAGLSEQTGKSANEMQAEFLQAQADELLASD